MKIAFDSHRHWGDVRRFQPRYASRQLSLRQRCLGAGKTDLRQPATRAVGRRTGAGLEGLSRVPDRVRQQRAVGKTLNQFQRSWLTTRDQCKDEDCLRQRYQQQLNRLRYLNDIAQHALPSPITPVKSTSCFHGSFSYEYVMSGLSPRNIAIWGSIFGKCMTRKRPIMQLA
nr:hypothetical protein KXZ65_10600 [Pectobacterium sp. PL152]